MSRVVGVLSLLVVTALAAAPPFSPYPLWAAPISPLGASVPTIAGNIVYGAPSSTEAYTGDRGFQFNVIAVDRRTGMQLFNKTVPYKNYYMQFADTGSVAASWQGASPQLNTSVVAAGFVGTNLVYGLDGATGAELWTRNFVLGQNNLVVRAIGATNLQASGERGRKAVPLAAQRHIERTVGVETAARSMDVVVVVFNGYLQGLHALTGKTLWGPVPIVGGQTDNEKRPWNIEVHAQRVGIFCSGGAVQGYDVFTGGQLWMVGSVTGSSPTYKGHVQVRGAIAAVQGIHQTPTWSTAGTAAAIDANTGAVVGMFRNACPDASLFGASTDGTRIVFNPPNQETANLENPCRIEVYDIPTKHLVWRSDPYFYARPAGLGNGEVFSSVTVSQGDTSNILMAFNLTTAKQSWKSGVNLGRFAPIYLDGVLYGQSDHTEDTAGIKSLLAVQVVRPPAKKAEAARRKHHGHRRYQ